jgi:peptide/nickel transport system permease protein
MKTGNVTSTGVMARPAYRVSYWRRIFSLYFRSSRDNWRIFSQNRLAVFGLVLLVIYAIMAVAHPILLATVWPNQIYNPETGFDQRIFPHPAPPSAGHLLGTDTLGRDVLSRLLAATTPTFMMAMTAALVTLGLSTLVGALSAYYRGKVDSFFGHLSDLLLLAPAPLVMVVIGGFGKIEALEFGLLYGLLAGLGGAAIIMRSYALTVMTKPFIDASRVAGAGAGRIIFKHLVPHMLPLAAVQMMLTITGAVFADGFSTFLGLSRIRLNWGSMIWDAFTFLSISPIIPWNVLLPPALAISMFAASFYFIARGLHEVAEPRIRQR